MTSEGWKVSMLDSSPGDDGGYKNVVLEVTGDSVYSKLKWEAGVHRVQRVPATEAQGRVHTSTATVAIMVRVFRFVTHEYTHARRRPAGPPVFLRKMIRGDLSPKKRARTARREGDPFSPTPFPNTDIRGFSSSPPMIICDIEN